MNEILNLNQEALGLQEVNFVKDVEFEKFGFAYYKPKPLIVKSKW